MIPPQSPPKSGSALQSGIHSHRIGDLRRAEAFYRQALAADENNAKAHYLLGVVAMQAGHPEAAVEQFQKSLSIDDQNADAYGDLGAARIMLGQTEAGLAALGRAAQIQPRRAQAHYNLGLELLHVGRIEEARRALAVAVRLRPKFSDAVMSLGTALMQLGRDKEGLRCLRRAAALTPDDESVRLNLGTALIQVRRLDEAEKELARISENSARRPEAAFLLGRMSERRRRPEAAAAYFREVLAADPEHADAHFLLGNQLLNLGLLDEAERHMRRALALRPDMPERGCNLGLILEAAGRNDEAAECFRSAGELGLVHLAEMYRRIGDFEQARGAIDDLRAANPDHPCIFSLLSETGQPQFSDSDRRRAEAIAEAGKGAPSDIARLHLALGRCYEAEESFEAAFDHFRRANELMGAGQNYDGPAEERWVERMVDAIRPELFQQLSDIGNDSDIPVFVVGMPRSGTSLVEQIIASHPSAEGAGELNHMRYLQENIRESTGSDQPFPRCIADIDREMARRLCENYLPRLTSVAPDAVRVVDKMPGNFLCLGLIALLFPRAHIVHCTRDPLDTCLSIYQQRFTGHHPYAYSLSALGHYYRLYERLMRHWQATLPMAIHEVRYETLIAEPAAQSKALIDFLGLDWDDRCLAFHETRRKVRTASAWQVRQPLYTTAVGRWRNYDAYLGDLKQALADSADG